jgi:hypothetical protein
LAEGEEPGSNLLHVFNRTGVYQGVVRRLDVATATLLASSDTLGWAQKLRPAGANAAHRLALGMPDTRFSDESRQLKDPSPKVLDLSSK